MVPVAGFSWPVSRAGGPIQRPVPTTTRSPKDVPPVQNRRDLQHMFRYRPGASEVFGVLTGSYYRLGVRGQGNPRIVRRRQLFPFPPISGTGQRAPGLFARLHVHANSCMLSGGAIWNEGNRNCRSRSHRWSWDWLGQRDPRFGEKRGGTLWDPRRHRCQVRRE